jgi:hypothetical protein
MNPLVLCRFQFVLLELTEQFALEVLLWGFSLQSLIDLQIHYLLRGLNCP